MDQKFELSKKNLLFSIIILLVIYILISIFDPLRNLFFGFFQNYYAGFSSGKKMFFFFWLIANMLITIFILKNSGKIKDFLKKNQKTILHLGILALFLGIGIGLTEFFIASNQFGGGVVEFAAMVNDNGIYEWEASTMSHNHFLKQSVYLIAQNIPFFPKNVDDGYPLYATVDLGPFPFINLLLVIIFALSSIIFLNSKSKEIGIFEYLIFLCGVLGLLISMLDGGIFDSTALTGSILLAVFFVSVYKPNITIHNIKINKYVFVFILFTLLSALTMILLQTIQLYTFFWTMSLHGVANLATILFFLYFIESIIIKKEKIKISKKFVALLIVFVIFSASLLYYFTLFGFGVPIEKSKTHDLMIYGKPTDVSTDQLYSLLKTKGKVENLKTTNWVATFKFQPFDDMHVKDLTKYLKDQIKPEGYFYVEMRKKDVSRFHYYLKKTDFDYNAISNPENYTYSKVKQVENCSDYYKLTLEYSFGRFDNKLLLLEDLSTISNKEKIVIFSKEKNVVCN